MPSTHAVTALSAASAVYAVALLYGFFVLQQILLAMLIATAFVLVGAALYFAWRRRGGSNGNPDSQNL